MVKRRNLTLFNIDTILLHNAWFMHNCPNNVLYVCFPRQESSLRSCIAFNCHVSLTFNLEQFLNLSLTFVTWPFFFSFFLRIQGSDLVEHPLVWVCLICLMITFRLYILGRNSTEVVLFLHASFEEVILVCLTTVDVDLNLESARSLCCEDTIFLFQLINL